MVRLGTTVFLALLGAATVGSAALAQTSDDLFASVFGNQEAPPPQETVVPVSVDGRDAGDVGAIVDLASGTARVNAGDLVDVLYRFVDPVTAQAIVDGADAEGFVDEATVRAAGLEIALDPGSLYLQVAVPADLRPQQDISLRGDYNLGQADEALRNADYSGYLNLYTGLDLVGTDTGGGQTGRQPIQSAFEGAINMLGMIVQADLFYQEDGVRRWQRGDIRAIFDNEADAVRSMFGDLNYPTAGFQGFVPMGGFATFRSFDIQPYTVTQPAGSQEFLLESASQIDVLVNGRQVDSFDLPAGPYRLSDFPVTTGANDVVLQIRDQFGRTQEIAFSQFYDGSLLAPGVSEFAVAAGYPSAQQNGLYDYDTALPSFTGFYREGLSETVTAGGNLQGSNEVALLGAELRLATPLGNFLIEPAGSWASGYGFDGAFTIQNELYEPLGTHFPGDRLWNLSATFRGPDFAQLGTTQPSNPVTMQLGARMSQLLDEDHSISIGARYGFTRDDGREDTSNLSILLRRRLWGAGSIDLTLERDMDTDGLIETSATVSLRIPLGYTDTARATWDSSDRGWELRWTHRPSNPMNAIATDIALDRDEDSQGMTGDLDYRHQRFEASFHSDLDNPRKDTTTRTRTAELDVATALVFAGGHVGVSRPVSDSFALVVPHPNLEDYQIGLNPNQGEYLAEVDWMGPAVLPDMGSYEYNTVIVEVPDLPFGYDLGDETPTVFPELTSGALVVVGTDATVLLGGTLVDNLGQPFALQAGEVRRVGDDGAEPAPFFTNRAGKFRIDGARPGDYVLRLYALPGLELPVVIPAEAEGLYDVGTVVVPQA